MAYAGAAFEHLSGNSNHYEVNAVLHAVLH